MRYLVTGAGVASSALPPSRAPRARPRRHGLGLVHRLLRPRAEGGERTRAARGAPRPGRGRSTSRASTACSIWPASQGCAASAASSPCTCWQNVLAEPAAVRGGGRGSARTCSPPRPRSTGSPAASTRPRGHRPAAALSVRHHEARLRAPRPRVRRGVRPGRCLVLRYFTIFGRGSGPMALARMVTCLAEDRPFELFGDGSQSRSFTFVDDAVEATIVAMERETRGCDVQRRRRGGGVRAAGARGAVGDRGPMRLGSSARLGGRRRDAYGGRHVANRRGSRLVPADVVRGGPRGSVALGR